MKTANGQMDRRQTDGRGMEIWINRLMDEYVNR